MTITLDPIKHTGAAPEPIVLLAEAEQLTFTGATLTDNMAATILSPTGTALASGKIAGNAVTLDTRTSQAWDYISAQACGVTAPALLAIGDADTLVAVMPVRVLRNNLYNLAPPSETVTVYPTMEQLREILAQIASADASAEDLVTRAEELGVSIAAFEQALPGMVSGAVTEIDGAKNAAVEAVGNAQTAAVNAVTNAQTDAVQAVGNAQTTAVNAVTEAQTAAVQAVQNKATEVSGEFDGKVTAAQNAATEAKGHATAAANSASAASQSASAASGSATAAGQSAEAADGSYQATLAIQEALGPAPWKSVFDVVSVSGVDIILDATKAYYAKTLTESAYTFAIDASGLALTDKVATVNLLLTIGETMPTIAFPRNVKFVGDIPLFPSFSETLLRLTSADQGESWIAVIVYENIVATSRSYVQDGLILQWDAKDNAGFNTHDNTLTTWADLVGGVELTLNGGATWGEKSLILDGTGFAQNLAATGYTDSLKTLEVVFKSLGANDYQNIVANIGTTFMFGFWNAINFQVGANTLYSRVFAISQELYSGVNTFAKPTADRNAYVNSEARVGTNGNWWTGTIADGITLGASNGGNWRKFTGEIMAVRGYSRDLTADEIKLNARYDSERF